MLHHSFFKIPKLKKILLILFSILIILSISILITTEIINSHPHSIQQTFIDTFNKIKVELEFKGLTKTVKDITEDYSKLFDGYSNIIITDDNGNILYNTNSGYISEKGKFFVLVDPWQPNSNSSDIAFLIDSNNNLKYSTQLEISLNLNKLKELSSKNALSSVLFSKTQDIDSYSGDKVITNSDGSSYVISSETKIIMNYEYIASKGLNLYSLYDSDHQFNNYFLFTNSIHTIRHWLIILICSFSILFWILLPLWVFKDAQERNLKAPIWTILVFLLSILGLAVYLIFRPKKISSNSNKTDDDWVLCPHCGKKVNIKN